MKLRSLLYACALFPILMAITMAVSIQFWLRGDTGLKPIDIMVMATIGGLGLGMTVAIVMQAQVFLRRISMLKHWIGTVLQGNLDSSQPVDFSGTDELSDLAQGLDQMLKELKSAYGQIHQEAQQNRQTADKHRQYSEASQLTTQHLTKALERLKESHDEQLQRERLHLLDLVLRGAAHDFSEAIMPISATCDLIRFTPDMLDDPQRRITSLATIESCADQCRQLAKNLAGYTNAFKEKGGPTDGAALIRQAVASIQQAQDTMPGSRSALDMRVEIGTIPPLAIAESDLRDALAHILRNAVEAMPSGGSIRIRAAVKREMVVITVSDTGHGMPEAVLKRCKEPYFTTRAGSARGIGLMVVHSIVQRYGGTLEIESEPQSGTHVNIFTPVWGSSGQKPDDGDAPTAHPPAGQKRLLFVDDEPAIRTVMAMVFSNKGYHVTLAEDAANAQLHLGNEPFDVVIVDRSMPDMSGDELAAAIRRTHPDMPVIMLTGYGDIMLAQGNIPEHVDVVLPKTAPVATLYATLDRALRGRIRSGVVATDDDPAMNTSKGTASGDDAREDSSPDHNINWLD